MNRGAVDTTHTIFALCSGSLPSAVAIEKISGKDAWKIADALFHLKDGAPLERKRGIFQGEIRTLRGERIDEGLLITFCRPNSHTGEDVVEFQFHGSKVVVQKIEEQFLEMGARPANRGEFSFRALVNGKVSAYETDQLGDLFRARDIQTVFAIHARREGSIRKTIASLRELLIQTQAILDTAVDFSEEYSSVIKAAEYPVERVLKTCAELIQRYETFKGAADAPKVVLYGRPNAGKSSIFNALLGKYRAIVSDTPGTTRDVVSASVELAGLHWELLDTAGIRKTENAIEQEGLSLGKESISGSEIRVLVVDSSEGFEAFEGPDFRPDLVAWNKTDLPDMKEIPEGIRNITVPVSAISGTGVAELWRKISSFATTSRFEHAPLPSRVEAERLKGTLGILSELKQGISAGNIPPEILAEKNREALRALEVVIGETSTDDVLDRLFNEFCIGK